MPALALIVDVAEAAFEIEVAQRDARYRRKMHIRHVGKRNRFAHRRLGMGLVVNGASCRIGSGT